MRRTFPAHLRALRTPTALVLCLALAVACKDRSGDVAVEDAAAEVAAPPAPASPEAIAALDALVAVEAPALGAGCSAEAALVSELLLALRPELDQLSAIADDGLTDDVVAPVAAALTDRAGALAELSPADDEVARAHRELGAALIDLAAAVHGLAGDPGDPGVATRLENGADNLAAALAALDRACAAP